MLIKIADVFSVQFFLYSSISALSLDSCTKVCLTRQFETGSSRAFNACGSIINFKTFGDSPQVNNCSYRLSFLTKYLPTKSYYAINNISNLILIIFVTKNKAIIFRIINSAFARHRLIILPVCRRCVYSSLGITIAAPWVREPHDRSH